MLNQRIMQREAIPIGFIPFQPPLGIILDMPFQPILLAKPPWLGKPKPIGPDRPFIIVLLPIMPLAPFVFFCSSVAPSAAVGSVFLVTLWEALLPRRSAVISTETFSCSGQQWQEVNEKHLMVIGTCGNDFFCIFFET